MSFPRALTTIEKAIAWNLLDRAGLAELDLLAEQLKAAQAVSRCECGYLQAPTEATRLIDTPGNPAFESGFLNTGQGAAAGLFKDQFGIVRLQGDVNPPNSASTIFTLPPGYRPAQSGATGPLFIVRADGAPGFVEVRSTGQVGPLSSYMNDLTLNGITFRAAD